MGTEVAQLHVMFFPYMAPGHVIPILDMAKLFGLRGAKTTLVTTPVNLPLISKTIQRIKDLGVEIDVRIFKFPSLISKTIQRIKDQGCENLDAITGKQLEMAVKFLKGTSMLQEPLELLLQESKPDCIVSDMFLPWTSYVAAKFGIPRLVFHGSSFFAICAFACLVTHEPHKKVSSYSEPFVVPGLPGDIHLTRKQLPDYTDLDAENGILMDKEVFE